MHEFVCCVRLFYQPDLIKVNESRYIALFVVRGPIKKLFSVDCVNI